MKRGRPPLDATGKSATVTVAMPARQFDDLCRQAQRQQVSVPEVIRQQLRAAAKRELKT